MLAALLWWGGAEAQDVILLRNADEVKAEVEALAAKIVSGEIAIDNDFSNLASTEHVALNIVE